MVSKWPLKMDKEMEEHQKEFMDDLKREHSHFDYLNR